MQYIYLLHSLNCWPSGLPVADQWGVVLSWLLKIQKKNEESAKIEFLFYGLLWLILADVIVRNVFPDKNSIKWR